MRIAHVLRRLSFDDWGGTEQVVWNIAKAQRAAGHEVRLFATTALCAKGRETVDGLDIVRFKPIYPWWPMPKELVAELDRKGGNPFVPGLGRALKEWKPDVVHCHAMARLAELCLRTAAQIGAKSVVSLHGGGANVPTAEATSLKAPTRGRFPWGKLVDYACGWTRRVPEDFDGIVCVGEDEYQHYKARHPHVMFLPNGVDCALFEGARDSRESSPPGQFTLVCVARIDRQKNQRLLVELLARHPDAVVRLVGPVTQPDYRAELEARAAELGVADRLSFAGALKPGSAELIAEYARADAFVLPSRHEPFGIVVLEAWAAGLPVIASDVGGLGRLCAAHPDAALTFAPGDAAALDAALARVKGAPDLRARLSAAGRAAARGYDWRTLAARLVDFY
jgi:glycosyltransferase involved in cell wall biosynthesis